MIMRSECLRRWLGGAAMVVVGLTGCSLVAPSDDALDGLAHPSTAFETVPWRTRSVKSMKPSHWA